MKSLEQKIVKEGKVYGGDILKVDCFLNHRIDVEFLNEIGKEFYSLYKGQGINKILTIEASGIGIACVTALNFSPVVPAVFAKKSASKNISGDVYTSKVFSYTHGKTYDVMVAKEHLGEKDKVLIIDDFLAKGAALEALVDICDQAGAEVVGVGIVIEKAYQGGGDRLREKGIRIESLARVSAMGTDGTIEFC
jgi:xanthine phosphoribosyltransferase